jgi:hypothetical protein
LHSKASLNKFLQTGESRVCLIRYESRFHFDDGVCGAAVVGTPRGEEAAARRNQEMGYRISRAHSKSRRMPLAGKIGKIVSVDPADPYGAYLVRFENGLQFRYQEDEFTALTRVEQDRYPRE